MRILTIAATALLASGCMEDMPRPEPGPGGPPPRECRNAGLGQFTGRPMNPRLRARLQRVSGAATVRVVRPDEAVTMDFRADRLTVSLDERGRIRTARCG